MRMHDASIGRSVTAGRKPDFFIVGAPKCGTTAMTYYLMQHPEIYMATKASRDADATASSVQDPHVELAAAKDLHFFGSDLHFNRPRMTREVYLSHFNGVSSEKRVGPSPVRSLNLKCPTLCFARIFPV